MHVTVFAVPKLWLVADMPTSASVFSDHREAMRAKQSASVLRKACRATGLSQNVHVMNWSWTMSPLHASTSRSDTIGGAPAAIA